MRNGVAVLLLLALAACAGPDLPRDQAIRAEERARCDTLLARRAIHDTVYLWRTDTVPIMRGR